MSLHAYVNMFTSRFFLGFAFGRNSYFTLAIHEGLTGLEVCFYYLNTMQNGQLIFN
jgi:hypothetical protein